MASNNNYYNSSFVAQVENEFQRSYLNGLPETQFVGFDCSNLDHLGHENHGQNYSMDCFGGGQNQGVKFPGFDQPDVVIHNKVNDVGANINQAHHSYDEPKSSSNKENNENDNDENNNLLIAISLSIEENKEKIFDIVSHAMDELRAIGLVSGEPLWKHDHAKNIQTLNASKYLSEYASIYVKLMELHKLIKVKYEPLPGPWPSNTITYYDPNDDYIDSLTEGLFKYEHHRKSPEEFLCPETSKEIANIPMRPKALVELLMDLDMWSQVFSDIVLSKPILLGVLASDTVHKNLQVMKVEYYCPSPLVPTRESFIARYCKKIDNGMWGVVDVSLERVMSYPSADKFCRQPSGCLIEEMPNGISKVIWVEHVMVDNRQVHSLLEPMVSCGFAFSAKRWLEILARQCERFSFPIMPSTSYNPLVDAAAGRRSLLRLSARMVRTFGVNMSASTKNKWDITTLSNVSTNLQDPVSMSIKSYIVDLLGTNPDSGVIFTTSLGFPTIPPFKVFDFLRDEKSRFVWDIMSVGKYSIDEIAYIKTSNRPGNRVSLIKVQATPDHISTMYLQESYADSAASYVVSSPLTEMWTAMILNGGNPELVRLIPSGFVVYPDLSKMSAGVSNGSVLTMARHCINDEMSIFGFVPQRSLVALNNTFIQTALAIKACCEPVTRPLARHSGEAAL